MINFFKNFGKGILYILVLPVLAIALAIYAVAALFIFIYLAFKGLILFFTGRSLYEDLPEDIEAKKRLGINKEEKLEPAMATNIEQYVETPNDDVSADPFYVPEYLRQNEEAEPESEFENEPEIEEQPSTPEKEETEDYNDPFVGLDRQEEPEPEAPQEEPKIVDEDVISVQKTVQNDSILNISDIEDDEDEESDSGINIDFN